MFGNFFDMLGFQDPSKASMPYLNDIEGKVGKYMNPYINAGLDALPMLQGQFKNLMNNPTALMSSIGSQFQSSPGYQYSVDQMTKAANNAGAASGMAGSPAEQMELAKGVNGLANQDYYNFLNHGINLYGQGVQGMQGINNMGFQGANTMSNALVQQLMAQAMNSYAGAANNNQSIGGLLGSVAGMFGGGGFF